MAEASDRGVLDVRVDVQAADADGSTGLDDEEEGLTCLVEAVDAGFPLLSGPGHERMAFGRSDLLEVTDVGASRDGVMSNYIVHTVNRTTLGPQLREPGQQRMSTGIALRWDRARSAHPRSVR